MRLTIATAGSRGDVQPYLALGRGLARAGYLVTIATHEEFRGAVEAQGLRFRPVAGDPRGMIESEAGQRWLASGRNIFAFVRELRRLAEPLVDRMLADYAAAVEEADVVLCAALAVPAWHAAERRGIPAAMAMLQPLTPTSAFPAMGAPPGLGPGWMRRLTHHLAEQMLWQPIRGRVNRWRRDTLGLPDEWRRGPGARMRRLGVPVLYGFSRHVVPPPSDWPASVQVTGWWTLDPPADYTPPAHLARFLDEGPPPVYVGFGSMTPVDAEALTATVLDAVGRVGARAVLLRGWGGLGDAKSGALPAWACRAADVPHSWLLPRMAAVVHHGGAGTTGAALRSGAPSIVVPLFADQPFWGERVRALGVGPRPIMRPALTAECLASALAQALGDAGMRERAARLGAALRAEDGVATAVAVVDRLTGRDSGARRASVA
jgi:UDP:flavonoid glycosyltransferase YjiC (YdhE family)